MVLASWFAMRRYSAKGCLNNGKTSDQTGPPPSESSEHARRCDNAGLCAELFTITTPKNMFTCDDKVVWYCRAMPYFGARILKQIPSDVARQVKQRIHPPVRRLESLTTCSGFVVVFTSSFYLDCLMSSRAEHKRTIGRGGNRSATRACMWPILRNGVVVELLIINCTHIGAVTT
jgi:hypothetical protein